MSTLITLLGGPESFISRLNYLHNSGLFDIGNEVSFLTVYQYHYAGRPALSTALVHTLIPALFNDTTTGLPGNDDSGAMASFTALSMSGLFPSAGQNVYFISPPFFPSISFTNPLTNKTATVRNMNFDESYGRIYVQNATLNGTPYAKNWIGHEFFLEGGVLELVLGESESAWGTGAMDVPPSMGTGAMKF